MLNILGGLIPAALPMLKNILPSVVNWGINKLSNTSFGKRILNPQNMQMASNAMKMAGQGIDTINQIANPQPSRVIEKITQTPQYEDIEVEDDLPLRRQAVKRRRFIRKKNK